MNEKNKGLLWGILSGSVIGFAAGLLLAPKNGKELRQDIAEGAKVVGDKTQQIAGIAYEQGSNIVNLFKDTAGTVIEDIRSWGKSDNGIDEEDEAVELAQISSFAGDEEFVFISDLQSEDSDLK
ncbi:YtxH domain-containing protein [Paenibacillus pini]|uniref:General stress protein n=1 Tax=Paenibacillus pini JCM 16418 TaxID=1236976 RepID=W7YDA5_9BACL|nr:YtxH domain-containing protein [Paenibacillus pini]GAF06452.1 hypothetical protein JCM16418_407 [Paenibacillus pini JCM 16418]